MEKADLSPWKASSLNNKVPCLFNLEKGQATGDAAQASKENQMSKREWSRRLMVYSPAESRGNRHIHVLWVGGGKLGQPSRRKI